MGAGGSNGAGFRFRLEQFNMKASAAESIELIASSIEGPPGSLRGT